MKFGLSMMALVVCFAASISGVQAQDNATEISKAAKSAEPVVTTRYFPRGGWDGNNLKLSATRSKLMSTAGRIFPGGGWDANNLRLSVSRSRLLPNAQ